MTTKQLVLSILEKHRGEAVSGGEISNKLKVTRSAVWKAVDSLREDGYIIEAVTNKGYLLSPQNKILSAASIMPHLNDDSYNILVYDELPSTNTVLKQAAVSGASDKTVVIANEQSGGRGRRGHEFFSPKDTGLYLSVLFRPHNVKASDAPVITTAAAAAICKAVEDVVGEKLSIKWINDLFLKGKKVCGILTEAATDFETSNVEYIVIGAGLNLIAPPGGFPGEIAAVAGAISNSPVDKSRLCAAIINYLDEYMADLKSRKFLEEYKKRLFVLGKDVTVISPSGDYAARAVDINDNAELIVVTPDGKSKLLNSGEIRVKGI